MYGVKLQAYHSGTMTGKDIQKVMVNASEIFSKFADILVANRKDIGMEPEDIRKICAQFANLCVLWYGAFLYASKIDPTANDITMYRRFVTAAVYCHKGVGCNITPKVHLMWKHVEVQMKLPGGLGKKREDWVEHHHQITSKERVQFRTTKDKDVRAKAMAGRHQQNTDPAVEAWQLAVDVKACKGPRKWRRSGRPFEMPRAHRPSRSGRKRSKNW